MNLALKILTLCQAVWVLTMMSYLMWYYIRKSLKHRIIEKNALLIGLSYIFMTGATVISTLKGFYNWYSVWQILVLVSYLLGDIVIVHVVFHTNRQITARKILEKYIEDNMDTDIKSQ